MQDRAAHVGDLQHTLVTRTCGSTQGGSPSGKKPLGFAAKKVTHHCVSLQMNRNGRRLSQALVVAASTAYASRMGAQKASYRMMSSKNGNTPKSAFKRAFEWYLGMLERHALPTKAITSGIIGAIGDMTCQKVVEGKKTIRVRRTVEFIAITGILVGPGLHYWCVAQRTARTN